MKAHCRGSLIPNGLTRDSRRSVIRMFQQQPPKGSVKDRGSYAPNLFQSSFLIRRAPNSRAPSRTKTQPTNATIVQVPAHLCFVVPVDLDYALIFLIGDQDVVGNQTPLRKSLRKSLKASESYPSRPQCAVAASRHRTVSGAPMLNVFLRPRHACMR
jgi:hypothetical protein